MPSRKKVSSRRRKTSKRSKRRSQRRSYRAAMQGALGGLRPPRLAFRIGDYPGRNVNFDNIDVTNEVTLANETDRIARELLDSNAEIEDTFRLEMNDDESRNHFERILNDPNNPFNEQNRDFMAEVRRIEKGQPSQWFLAPTNQIYELINNLPDNNQKKSWVKYLAQKKKSFVAYFRLREKAIELAGSRERVNALTRQIQELGDNTDVLEREMLEAQLEAAQEALQEVQEQYQNLDNINTRLMATHMPGGTGPV